MTTRRRRFTAAFKKRVALEALRGEQPVQAIAAKHQVHPNQVSAWKRQAVEGLDEVFSGWGAESRSAWLVERGGRAFGARGAEPLVAVLQRIGACVGSTMYLRPVYGSRRWFVAAKEPGAPADAGDGARGAVLQAASLRRVYPYLLRGVNGPDHVWCADLTSVSRGICTGGGDPDWESRHRGTSWTRSWRESPTWLSRARWTIPRTFASASSQTGCASIPRSARTARWAGERRARRTAGSVRREGRRCTPPLASRQAACGSFASLRPFG